jgi:MGT family glycosyltransferase
VTIVVVNVPAFGHVNPTLYTCAQLVRRGHSVHYYCGSSFRAVVEPTGAVFHEVDYGEVEGVMTEDPTNIARMLPAAMRTARAFLAQHAKHIAGLEPDLLMYDNTCFWARDLAQQLGAKTVAGFSIFVMDPDALRTVPEFKMLSPLAVISRGNPLRQVAGFIAFRREYTAYRRENGTPRRPLSSLWRNEGDLNLVYSLRTLQPGGENLGDQYRFIGPVIREESDDETVIPAGEEPLVFVSLGTLPHGRSGFLNRTVDAINRLGFRGVIATGRGVAPESIAHSSHRITVVEFAPQIRVLKQAAAFVSHGGMNSTHESLAFAVPLAFVPRQEEQALVANQVVRRGAGLLMDGLDTSTDSIVETVRSLVEDSQYRAAARRLQSEFRDAWIEPADLIESISMGGRR